MREQIPVSRGFLRPSLVDRGNKLPAIKLAPEGSLVAQKPAGRIMLQFLAHQTAR